METLPEFARWVVLVAVVAGVVGGIWLLILLFWAPLKLYSIDRTLKEILEELRARGAAGLPEPPVRRGQAGVGSAFGR